MKKLEGKSVTFASIASLDLKSLTLAYMLLMVLLVGAAAVTTLNAIRILEDTSLVNRTYDVRAIGKQVFYEVVKAESEQRYFLLTLDEDGAERTAARSFAARQSVETLSTLVSDNPEQSLRVERLRSLLDARLKRLSLLIEARRVSEFKDMQRQLGMARGVEIMTQFEDELTLIMAEEDRQLGVRMERSQNSVFNASVGFFVSSLVGVSFLTGFYLLVRRYAAQQAAARAVETAYRDQILGEVRDRVAAQQSERKILVELRRSNRELQDFAFVASHDLQEPLRKIQQFGDRLRRRDESLLSPEGVDSLDRMQNAAQRMQGLIHDLLTFSRVSSKALPFQRVDLAKVVHTVTGDLESRMIPTGATVSVGELPTIDADPTQMHQLLQNLIGNALKFAKEGEPARVEVLSEMSEHAVTIIVKDHGIGFEQKHADKIFTIFQRLHGRSEYEGSGIGLAICRKIVERHAGNIVVNSSPGVGTEFRIELPRTQEEVIAHAA